MLIQQEIAVPGTETKQELLLRPIEADDLSTLSPYDPEIAKYIPQKYVDISKGLCAGDPEAIKKLATEPDAAYWGVFSSEARMLGFTGLHSIVSEDRDLHSRGIGIVLNSQNFKQGIASRTHPYRSGYAFTKLGLKYVSGKAAEGNNYSLRAVTGAGYISLGLTTFPELGVDAVLIRQYNPDRFSLDEVVEMASKDAAENGHDLEIADVETAYEITQQNLERVRGQLSAE